MDLFLWLFFAVSFLLLYLLIVIVAVVIVVVVIKLMMFGALFIQSLKCDSVIVAAFVGCFCCC